MERLYQRLATWKHIFPNEVGLLKLKSIYGAYWYNMLNYQFNLKVKAIM